MGTFFATLIIIFSISTTGFAKNSLVENLWENMKACPALTRAELGVNIQLRPFTKPEVNGLLKTLSLVPMGKAYATLIRKFMREGLTSTGTETKLKFYILRNQAVTTAAEFYENGSINIKESALKRILNSRRNKFSLLTPETAIDLSFVIHEVTHAIAYFLNQRNSFPSYDSQSKINEALAYYSQGHYLNELRKHRLFSWEDFNVSSWDKCVHSLSKIYAQLGITPNTSDDEAMDKLTDLQLDAFEHDEIPDGPFVRLTTIYDSFFSKNRHSWHQTSMGVSPTRVVTDITHLIEFEVNSVTCDMRKTFNYMNERITLYSVLQDSPNDVPPCDYFKEFSTGLLKHLPVGSKTYYDVLNWLIRKY